MSNIVIKSFREHRKGALVGFVTIEIPSVGLEIRGISWFNQNGRQWFNMPSEKYTNEDGEEKYRPHVAFPEKRVYTAWQDAMREAMREYVATATTPPDHTDQGIPF